MTTGLSIQKKRKKSDNGKLKVIIPPDQTVAVGPGAKDFVTELSVTVLHNARHDVKNWKGVSDLAKARIVAHMLLRWATTRTTKTSPISPQFCTNQQHKSPLTSSLPGGSIEFLEILSDLRGKQIDDSPDAKIFKIDDSPDSSTTSSSVSASASGSTSSDTTTTTPDTKTTTPTSTSGVAKKSTSICYSQIKEKEKKLSVVRSKNLMR
ncbi:hypothetical protein FXO38_22078 [Capsicum annuum]|nr:hypothetical protein FXO38_22078 [Capsicum annuum]